MILPLLLTALCCTALLRVRLNCRREAVQIVRAVCLSRRLDGQNNGTINRRRKGCVLRGTVPSRPHVRCSLVDLSRASSLLHQLGFWCFASLRGNNHSREHCCAFRSVVAASDWRSIREKIDRPHQRAQTLAERGDVSF